MVSCDLLERAVDFVTVKKALFFLWFRLSFPDSWRSLQDKELCAAAGVHDCIFIHSCGHLGVNKTKDGAIKMAQLVVRDSAANELELTETVLPPPIFSRGRGGRRGRTRANRS